MKNLKPFIYLVILLLSFNTTAQTRVIKNKTKIRGAGAIENTAPDSLLTYGSDKTLNYTKLTDFATKIGPLLPANAMLEGYQETGQRMDGDLVVTLGEWEGAGNSTQIVIDDTDNGLFQEGQISLISDRITFRRNPGSPRGTFSAGALSADREFGLPNQTGTLALLSDTTYNIVTTSESETNKFIGGDQIYIRRFNGSGEIQINNLPVANEPFQNLDINAIINITDLANVVESTLYMQYRNYEETITALNLDEYTTAWDGTDWVVTESFGGNNDVGVINPADNLVYTDDSYTTQVTDALSNPLPAAVIAIDALIPVPCGITNGTGNVQFISTNNIIDFVEVYNFYVIVEYTKI